LRIRYVVVLSVRAMQAAMVRVVVFFRTLE